jgi:23S rRNA-/tRNA-specific pseudouridylate synthase
MRHKMQKPWLRPAQAVLPPCLATSVAASWHHAAHTRLTLPLPCLQALALPSGSLSNPHRLDTGTEGLLVLARSSAFARYFSLLLQHKGHEVRKL